ncbi:MAG: hypothetical protein K1X72_11770 [Pyrinomonadaceae bacterium]|nr:hypothetical protein [Pyrinomonadaceae bacterium]
MKRKKEKSLRISEAVFRGSKTTYNFEVFPMDIEFQETAAVFIISRRKIDKIGKGHHKFICIGQTDSIIKELKKHKKGKCVKQNKANVVCLLAEADEKIRLKIEEDLKSAYRIPCLHN